MLHVQVALVAALALGLPGLALGKPHTLPAGSTCKCCPAGRVFTQARESQLRATEKRKKEECTSATRLG